MEQIRTAVPAQEPSFHPRPAAATITDLMQLPPTVQQHDHARRIMPGSVRQMRVPTKLAAPLNWADISPRWDALA
jgi:hypothetical protein